MKRIDFLIIIVFGVLLYAGWKILSSAHNIKVGDILVVPAEELNPFDDTETTQRLVLAISGKFVQYRYWSENGDVYTNSSYVEMFR